MHRLGVAAFGPAVWATAGGRVKTKDTVRDLLDRLPDDCTLEDVLYHLYVVQAVDRGLADAEAGRTISHERVAEEMRRKWVLGAAG
jgi:hypothetical protein